MSCVVTRCPLLDTVLRSLLEPCHLSVSLEEPELALESLPWAVFDLSAESLPLTITTDSFSLLNLKHERDRYGYRRCATAAGKRADPVPVQKRCGRGIGAGHVAVISFALRVRRLMLVRGRRFLGQTDMRRGLFLVDSRVVLQFFLGQMAGQRAVATVKTA